MDYSEIILSEFNPLNSNGFLQNLIFKEDFDINLYHNFYNALSNKSGGSIDVTLQERLCKDIGNVFAYVRLLNVRYIELIGGKLNYQISNLPDMETLNNYMVDLNHKIYWFIDEYLESTITTIDSNKEF